MRKSTLVVVLGLAVIGTALAGTDRQCMSEARDQYSNCRTQCSDDFTDARDACQHVNHRCAEACRAGRDACIDPIQQAMEACYAPCREAFEAARLDCKARYCPNDDCRDNADFIQCMNQPQVDAFVCRDTCRDQYWMTHRIDLQECRRIFRACLKACPRGRH